MLYNAVDNERARHVYAHASGVARPLNRNIIIPTVWRYGTLGERARLALDRLISSSDLPLVLSLATSLELNSLELFDVFSTDQASMDVEPKYPQLELKRLNKSTFSTKNLINSSTDRTVNPWNTLPEIRGVSQRVTTTENSMNTSRDNTIYDPWSAILEIGEPDANNASYRKLGPIKQESLYQDPLSTFLEVERLHANTTFNERSPNSSSDETVHLDPLQASLEVHRLHENSFLFNMSTMKSRNGETVNQDLWNHLLDIGRLSKRLTTTEIATITRMNEAVYRHPMNDLVEEEGPHVNNASTERSIKDDSRGNISHDERNASLEVGKLSKNVISTEHAIIISGDETVYHDPLNDLLEEEGRHVNNASTETSIKPNGRVIFFHDPWNASLEVGNLSKSITATENFVTRSYKTVYQDPLNALLEVEKLHVNNASTERSMKLNSRGIFFLDPWNSVISRSYKTVYQDPLNALLEIERLQVKSASTERSMKSSSGGIVLQDPWNMQSEVESLSINIDTTKKSMKTSSYETIYQDEINALKKERKKKKEFHANGVFNKSLMKTKSDKMVNQYLLNSFLELGRVSKTAATTKNSINASTDRIDEEPWDPLRELEKLNENSATTESSMTASSVDVFSQNSWSSLLKAGGLSKSVATTENLIAASRNNINNQDSLNPLMEVEKLHKIDNTTMNSTINITVIQESGNALPELEGLDKGIGTTERSIIPSSNITVSEISTNVSLEVKKQVHSSIGVPESLVLASTNETTTKGFLKVTVGYRRMRPTRASTVVPHSPLNLSSCPEEERPRNFGAYEVPTQRDLVLQVRTTLLGSYRAYHRRAFRVLKHMKEATKASWPLANSCHATSRQIYQRCVRRVSQRCELTSKSLVLALESLKQDVMDLIQGNICNISAMNVDPIKLIRILAMERVSLGFALPGFLRLLNACNVYCSRGPTKYANFTHKRIQKMNDEQLVVEHFLTKKNYAQLIKGAT